MPSVPTTPKEKRKKKKDSKKKKSSSRPCIKTTVAAAATESNQRYSSSPVLCTAKVNNSNSKLCCGDSLHSGWCSCDLNQVSWNESSQSYYETLRAHTPSDKVISVIPEYNHSIWTVTSGRTSTTAVSIK